MQDAKRMVAMIGNKAETEAGLIVPAHSIEPAERKQVRWLYDSWKRIRRVFSQCAVDGILLLPTCATCLKQITIVSLDPAVALDPDDRKMIGKFALRCPCTDRVIVKGV